MRPRWNAPMPARYIQRIYSIENTNIVDVCYRDDFQEVKGSYKRGGRRVRRG